MVRLSLINLVACSIGATAAQTVDGSDLDLEVDSVTHPEPRVTTTIPYLGTTKTWTTLRPCSTGPVIVVIQTPIKVTQCGGHSATTSHTATQTTPTTVTSSETKTTNTASHTTTSSSSSSKCPEPTPGGPCRVRYGCPAQGLDIAYYANPFGGYSRQGSGLSSSYYLTQDLRPRAASLTNQTYFPQDTPPDASAFPRVYPRPADLPGAWYAVGWTRATNGGLAVDANNFTVVYTGFYRAPESGVFRLCTTADNENDVFWGHGAAFDCVTGRADPKARPTVVSTGGNYINGINCTDVTLAEGEYYPLRSVTGNWQGPSAFNLTVKRPSESFENRKNIFDGLVFPHSCGSYF
ncbi:hypothetical protein JDV02_000169 [Purpureocillium takamizusanense]|uniref:PA14 domain-containing protein n=1 Tax=Purpureocillium takamizusanense TaxID=2060973 RepID=A0A9Q8Q657_9HYPO|nr:uncharacterized protein JDV02_000169 [Purpureocillium takamizusanense]UNI13421.1 hypothetical protein JDV02_000169 [Purpureocillium takamizusanense]